MTRELNGRLIRLGAAGAEINVVEFFGEEFLDALYKLDSHLGSEHRQNVGNLSEHASGRLGDLLSAVPDVDGHRSAGCVYDLSAEGIVQVHAFGLGDKDWRYFGELQKHVVNNFPHFHNHVLSRENAFARDDSMSPKPARMDFVADALFH